MAAIDEIVFHQLLRWHSFYDRASGDVGIVSDGILHAAEVLLLVAGLVVIADLRGRRVLAAGHAWAGLFLGLGGFQLVDGLVLHKVLDLHEIRYRVEILPYDLAWIGAALILLAVGTAILARARSAPGR